MNQIAVESDIDRLSLQPRDLEAIQSQLPSRWTLMVETGDDGEVYARLLAPRASGLTSAFLFEREDDIVIMTDNVTDLERCMTGVFPSADQAMLAVLAVIKELDDRAIKLPGGAGRRATLDRIVNGVPGRKN